MELMQVVGKYWKMMLSISEKNEAVNLIYHLNYIL